MKRYYMQIAAVIAIVMVACTVLPLVIDSMSAHTVARYYETTTVDTVRSNSLIQRRQGSRSKQKALRLPCFIHRLQLFPPEIRLIGTNTTGGWIK